MEGTYNGDMRCYGQICVRENEILIFLISPAQDHVLKRNVMIINDCIIFIKKIGVKT